MRPNTAVIFHRNNSVRARSRYSLVQTWRAITCTRGVWRDKRKQNRLGDLAPFLVAHAKLTSQRHVTVTFNLLDDHSIAKHTPISRQDLKKNKKGYRHLHSSTKAKTVHFIPQPLAASPTPHILWYTRMRATLPTYDPSHPTQPFHTIRTVPTCTPIQLNPLTPHPPQTPTKKKIPKVKKEKKTESRPRNPSPRARDTQSRLPPSLGHTDTHTHTPTMLTLFIGGGCV